MGWFKRRRAAGGTLPPRSAQMVAGVVSPGIAVVSDAALAKHGRAYFEALNDGRSQVYSASEMAALQDESP